MNVGGDSLSFTIVISSLLFLDNGDYKREFIQERKSLNDLQCKYMRVILCSKMNYLDGVGKAPAMFKACSKSSKRSSTSSIPTHKRIKSSGRERSART